MSVVFDATPCTLGEGPLWHPEREQLFWFDIPGQTLHGRKGDTHESWNFDEMVSAAGWVDHDTLLIASESCLSAFSLVDGTSSFLAGLESDRPETRSNDGRADPFGGFWIGTMAKDETPGAGAIYRYYQGELRRLYGNISIPNAICFPPDGRHACYADTLKQRVLRVALDDEGWPDGKPELMLDLREAGLNPDGAVFDAEGTLWLAQWGAARVAAYAPDGRLLRTIAFDAPNTSCPAFGGPDLATLFCTTARQGLDAAILATHPLSGQTFCAPSGSRGLPEHRVIL